MDSDPIVRLREYENDFEAEHDVAFLENAGIPVMPVGFHNHKRIGRLIELRVLASDYAAAVDLLQSIGRTFEPDNLTT